MMNTTDLIFKLYEINAVQFGEFTLKSGKSSTVYINLRKIISYPNLLRDVANCIWHTIHAQTFERICGVPYTALPIATCISLQHNIPMIMRRKEQKNYGTKQMIEGEFEVGMRCLIVEDIITTGSSILETANDLKNAGLKTQDVVALIDREEGGMETLEQSFHTHAVLTLSQIFDTLLNSTRLNTHEKNCIDTFIAEKKTA